MSEYIILSIFLFLGAFIAAAATVTGLLLGYRTRNTKNKMAPYECGMETIGNARIQFKVGYYLFALLFLVFDIFKSIYRIIGIHVFKDVSGLLRSNLT